jgi:trimeric autotransporter adhesin
MPRSNASFLGQLLGTSQKITASALDSSVSASLGGGVDSAAIIGIIDSDYVQTRAPSVDLSAINQSIIPNTNATYDIGSASYKIRDLYVSDNSLHIGENILSVNASKLLFNGEDVMDYASLTGAPTSFDGAYSSLTGTPTLFDGAYASLTGTPTLFNGAYSSLTGTPTLFDGAYSSLTGTPTSFDGAYSSLTGTPTILDSAAVAAIANQSIDIRAFNANAQGNTYGYTAGGIGAAYTPSYNVIDKFLFASNANATDVGNLTSVLWSASAQQSLTYGYISGGGTGNGTNPTGTNRVQSWPFASNANTVWTGAYITAMKHNVAGASSSTDGYIMAGFLNASTQHGVIEKFPFSTNASSAQTGLLTLARFAPGSNSSATRGYAVGGATSPGVSQNVIDKFPFAAGGNATDVGDLPTVNRNMASQNSGTHGYATGGGNRVTDMRKFSFATDGNATDVADLPAIIARAAGQSTGTDGYTSGGYTTSGPANVVTTNITKFSFATDANAVDYAQDLTVSRMLTSGTQY